MNGIQSMLKDHSHEIDSTNSITEQASAWWILLNDGDATPADHHAFGEWVARSPERVEAFLQTARLTRALQSSDLRWPDTPVATLISEARAAAVGVIDLPMRHATRASMQSGASPRTRRAIVASIVAVAAGLALWVFSSPDHYTTAIGEQRSVVLSDGTVITLNTSSEIEVRMRRDRRTVELLSGEALFEVARDPLRPFDVTAGKTNVRAVGTQFNVDRRQSTTTVTVVEGKVAVGNLPLAAGEQLIVAPNRTPRAARVDPAKATLWTRRKLVFEHRPLGEVAEEFNRYNRERIDIESPQLRNQEITGVFEANNPESFTTFLATIPDVVVERTGDKRVIVREAQKP